MPTPQGWQENIHTPARKGGLSDFPTAPLCCQQAQPEGGCLGAYRQVEAQVLAGHDGPVLGTGDMGDAQNVPATPRPKGHKGKQSLS